jgi:hypothetical protein
MNRASVFRRQEGTPMTTNDTAHSALLEQAITDGLQAMAQVMTALMNVAMKLEHEQFLGAAHYERAPGRRREPTASRASAPAMAKTVLKPPTLSALPSTVIAASGIKVDERICDAAPPKR